jgi:1,4-alpha-glucan branching enzyme
LEKGLLAMILHAHLPFVRHPEYMDSLEENWLFEAMTESYIPLLLMMEELVRDEIDFRLTFSISPTLASMLMDPFLQSRYVNRLETLIELGEKEIQRTRLQPIFNRLAHTYLNHLLRIYDTFLNQYNCNLIQAFTSLQDLGKIEIMAGAATHAYLPLLSMNPSAVRAQIQIGIDFHKQFFMRQPKGFWLPECGYFPGVNDILKMNAINYFILETHGITRAESRPRNGVYAPITCPSGIAAFGRDPMSSKQVWSATEGYPGDFDYREFYRDIGYDLDMDYIAPFIHRDGIRIDTGFKYYRVTGKHNHKAIYDPYQAREKARIHANHFINSRVKQIEFLKSVMDRSPIIVAPYDAELFGHWWFEGPMWLNFLIRKISKENKALQLITLGEYLDIYKDHQATAPCISSWGYKGYHGTWLNERNDWIYQDLHHGAMLMEEIARDYPLADGIRLRALRQSARELLLAQGSDWAFMMKSGGSIEYAASRVKTHTHRLKKLNREIRQGTIDKGWLSEIENRDNIFQEIDYRVFKRLDN